MKKIIIDVWSDFVCPWCWIAKTRMERAIKNFPSDVVIEVNSKAYRLARNMAPMDFKRALIQKFGGEYGARQMMAAVSQQGEMEGLKYNFDTMRFGDTSDAHALVKHVVGREAQNSLIEALMKASITDGLDIFDRDILKNIALQSGVSADTVDSCKFDQSSIAQDEKQASQVANGVPLFVFNTKLYLSGAQPLTVFQDALNSALDYSSVEAVGSQAPSCDDGACRIT